MKKRRQTYCEIWLCLLILHQISLAIAEALSHISSVFMGCFPCDTRLEAFPPYLSRVRSLARLFSGSAAKIQRTKRLNRAQRRLWMSWKGGGNVRSATGSPLRRLTSGPGVRALLRLTV